MKRELTATEARQARPGRPVLYILVIGLALALIAMTLVWIGQDNDPDAAASIGAPSMSGAVAALG